MGEDHVQVPGKVPANPLVGTAGHSGRKGARECACESDRFLCTFCPVHQCSGPNFMCKA